MSSIIIYILLLCILHSILFFNNHLGLNVVVFLILLITLIIFSLSKNHKIKYKRGLLFIIPIILLSSTYLVYDNTFKYLNIIIIPILCIFMYMYTINPTYKLAEIINNFFTLIFAPLDCIGKFYNIVKLELNKVLKLSSGTKKKIKSILLVLPIVIVVLLLLMSADMIFDNIISKIFSVLKSFSLDNILLRLLVVFILFTYLGSVINYLMFNYKETKIESSENKVETYTIKVLLTSLNIIYIIFDIIQIRSLLFHHVSKNIVYSEYARSGFFQLMTISLINLIILLVSKKSKNSKYNNFMSVLMVLLTFIIIISSFLRMYMYETAYGYTILRLLVYISLITEAIMLLPTIIYILNPKVKIIRYYILIIVTVYTLINLISVDYVIARNNINRYYRTNSIDLYYLQNNCLDNTSLLIELYDKTDDEKIKYDLERYFNKVYRENKKNNIFEYNISRDYAHKKINSHTLN